MTSERAENTEVERQAESGPTMCARHPNTETELRCSRCETPICARCMIHTPVGARCPTCAQVRRIPTYNISGQAFGRATAAAAVGGVIAGGVWAFFNILTFFFFGLLAGLAVGFAVGELVSISTGRRAGPPLQGIAVAGVIVAYATRVMLLIGLDGDWALADVRTDVFGFLGAAIACFIAANRLR
jgi:hypothetical protein